MKRIALASLAACGLALASCATSAVDLQPTNRNPGSEGRVVAKETRDGNTQLLVTLDHLPQPGVMDAQTYVAWIKPEGGDYVALGQVPVGADRRGRLQTVTPYETFDVLVTAETTTAPREPSNKIMLRGAIDSRD